MIKRIAMLTDNADPLAPLGGHEAGGENVYVLEMSKALGKLGWTVDIFTRWSYAKTARVAKVAENVRVIRLPAGPVEFVAKEKLFPYMPEYIKNFSEFREKNKLEYLLVHGNYYLSGWAGVELSKKLHIPMVNTFHTLGIVKHNALGTKDPSPTDRVQMEKFVMENADKIIATSPQMRDELTGFYDVPGKKIVVIAEGANLKRFAPLPQILARRVLRITNNRLIVLYVGRLERRKGVDTLLHAMAEVGRILPQKRKILRLYIAGGEPRKRWKDEMSVEREERARLIELVEKLGVGDMVRFVGGIDREYLPFYYSAADVTVVPSYYEPFGLVPLESMACGTPVIASRVGGLQSSIKDGKTGYLVKARDHLAFAEKISYLLTHLSVQKNMRENGIERVKRFFSWDEVAMQMSNFYHDLLVEYYFRKYREKDTAKIIMPQIQQAGYS